MDQSSTRQLSKEAIEAIVVHEECYYQDYGANRNTKIRSTFMVGATEALTNPSIYEKAGLMQTDGLLPESFNNEKVLTLLAISLRHLNSEQLANLLKSITQRSKEATEKAGLISLEDAMEFAEWARLDGWNIGVNSHLWKHYMRPLTDIGITTAQLFQIYKQQKP